jgi:hypothetical protein
MAEFMGCNVDYFRFYGFISDSGLRNTFGIEKAYCFELIRTTLDLLIWHHMKLLGHKFEGYAKYGLSDIMKYVISECQKLLAFYLESTLS